MADTNSTITTEWLLKRDQFLAALREIESAAAATKARIEANPISLNVQAVDKASAQVDQIIQQNQQKQINLQVNAQGGGGNGNGGGGAGGGADTGGLLTGLAAWSLGRMALREGLRGIEEQMQRYAHLTEMVDENDSAHSIYKRAREDVVTQQGGLIRGALRHIPGASAGLAYIEDKENADLRLYQQADIQERTAQSRLKLQKEREVYERKLHDDADTASAGAGGSPVEMELARARLKKQREIDEAKSMAASYGEAGSPGYNAEFSKLATDIDRKYNPEISNLQKEAAAKQQVDLYRQQAVRATASGDDTAAKIAEAKAKEKMQVYEMQRENPAQAGQIEKQMSAVLDRTIKQIQAEKELKDTEAKRHQDAIQREGIEADIAASGDEVIARRIKYFGQLDDSAHKAADAAKEALAAGDKEAYARLAPLAQQEALTAERLKKAYDADYQRRQKEGTSDLNEDTREIMLRSHGYTKEAEAEKIKYDFAKRIKEQQQIANDTEDKQIKASAAARITALEQNRDARLAALTDGPLTFSSPIAAWKKMQETGWSAAGMAIPGGGFGGAGKDAKHEGATDKMTNAVEKLNGKLDKARAIGVVKR